MSTLLCFQWSPDGGEEDVYFEGVLVCPSQTMQGAFGKVVLTDNNAVPYQGLGVALNKTTLWVQSVVGFRTACYGRQALAANHSICPAVGNALSQADAAMQGFMSLLHLVCSSLYSCTQMMMVLEYPIVETDRAVVIFSALPLFTLTSFPFPTHASTHERDLTLHIVWLSTGLSK